jgi:two-component system, LuxR family, response regulator FixJ
LRQGAHRYFALFWTFAAFLDVRGNIATNGQNNTMASPRPTILVVDDDEAVRNSLKFSLEIEGYTVRIYARAGELLSEIDLPSEGCLVIDYRMPGLNGVELLGNLRARGCMLPAILATTYVNASLRERIATAGMVLVEKPFIGNLLPDAINEALGRRSRHLESQP